jgi:hypothetical protein
MGKIKRDTYVPRLGEINAQVPMDEHEYQFPF